MRYYIALVFCLLLAPSYVYACLSSSHEHILFFIAIPNPEPEADVIAIVSMSDKAIARSGRAVIAMATVVQVVKTSDARVKQGEEIAMQLSGKSCSRVPSAGSKGMIIAKIGTNSKGGLILHPYTHTGDGDDRLTTPPFMLPEGFTTDLDPYRLGK